MRFQGSINEWRDDQGYGFIVPNGGGDRVFVHVKAFRRGSRRPVVGQQVNYVVARDARGRLRAEHVEYPASPVQPRRPAGGPRRLPLLVAAGFLVAVAVLAAMAKVPWLLFLAYAALSLATFGCYATDKSAAQRGTWRVQESTLQLLALLGGWPGAVMAQQWLRHKNRKPGFQAVFWLAVAINLLAFGWLLSDGLP
ncbi:MAG: hypothetical protein BGP24_15940 [Lysobacterales bacterium 69-70]|nr:MAG: hypothetical protein ABS97_04510 [Xanthomonadaceae bacterium SCN 69-320]ODV22903.1 MAG: hypothetical protein ABT27_00105 [Xanthomonadaceae bacterium SCN 69-25]OJY96785.1 MAG: hypothetical protein BGP24_15940 [Xanthomonadales bacterium 69-70]